MINIITNPILLFICVVNNVNDNIKASINQKKIYQLGTNGKNIILDKTIC